MGGAARPSCDAPPNPGKHNATERSATGLLWQLGQLGSQGVQQEGFWKKVLFVYKYGHAFRGSRDFGDSREAPERGKTGRIRLASTSPLLSEEYAEVLRKYVSVTTDEV